MKKKPIGIILWSGKSLIDGERIAVVATSLAKIQVPSIMFIGSGSSEGSGGDNLTNNLVQLKLLESTGLFDKINVDKTQVTRKTLNKK